MANGIEVVMEAPPWVPSGMMNGKGMMGALESAATVAMNDFAFDFGFANRYTWETTSSAGGWPSEATVMIAFQGVDMDVMDAEFGSSNTELRHAIARFFDI